MPYGSVRGGRRRSLACRTGHIQRSLAARTRRSPALRQAVDLDDDRARLRDDVVARALKQYESRSETLAKSVNGLVRFALLFCFLILFPFISGTGADPALPAGLAAAADRLAEPARGPRPITYVGQIHCGGAHVSPAHFAAVTPSFGIAR